MTNLTDIVVVSAVRTPIGKFGGALRDVPVYELGALAMRTALVRIDLPGRMVDETVMGNCRQAGNGPNPARTASVKGGIPMRVPAQTVNMACPSAMKALQIAVESIISGRNRIVVAGGMDSMSSIPYLLKNCRWEGFKSGDRVLLDGWSDNVDPLVGYGMGMSAENLAMKFGISRAEQDRYAVKSHKKAAEAAGRGYFKNEIVPVSVAKAGSKTPVIVEMDEVIRGDTSLRKLNQLRSVFKEGGTVTAGNASAMADGAVACVLTTRGQAHKLGLVPLFSFVSFSCLAVEPAFLGEGPAKSIPAALKAARMEMNDIDLFEINEAFAVQMLANIRALGIPQGKLNAFGGAIALGHPTGVSGARIVVTLYNALRVRGKELGCAAIGGAGGITMAAIIKRES